MDKDIFVIFGQYGMHEDAYTSAVCYVETEEEAKKYVNLATNAALDIYYTQTCLVFGTNIIPTPFDKYADFFDGTLPDYSYQKVTFGGSHV